MENGSQGTKGNPTGRKRTLGVSRATAVQEMGSLHLFFTTAIPEGFLKPDPEYGRPKLIITGFDDRPRDVPLEPGEVEYVSVLASNFHDPIAACEAVDEWWPEYAGAPARLELIGDDLALISERDRMELAEQESETLCFLTGFVGFERGSSDAREEAVELVMELGTVQH
jgi:hypothetical protein